MSWEKVSVHTYLHVHVYVMCTYIQMFTCRVTKHSFSVLSSDKTILQRFVLSMLSNNYTILCVSHCVLQCVLCYFQQNFV